MWESVALYPLGTMGTVSRNCRLLRAKEIVAVLKKKKKIGYKIPKPQN